SSSGKHRLGAGNQQIRAAFPFHGDIDPPVNGQILGDDLQPGSDASFIDRVTFEAIRIGDTGVVVEAGWLLAARVFAVVSVIAFAGDQLIASVTIEIGKDHAVRLAVPTVDQMLFPEDTAISLAADLLPPVEAEIVAIAKDEIVFAVAIEVADE